jgi:hypothetical protein
LTHQKISPSFAPGRTIADYDPRELIEMEFMYWKEVVKKHTTCNLTFIKDRLVTLSGVASELQELLGVFACGGGYVERAFTAFLVMVYNTFGDANYQATGIRRADVVSGINSKRNRIP